MKMKKKKEFHLEYFFQRKLNCIICFFFSIIFEIILLTFQTRAEGVYLLCDEYWFGMIYVNFIQILKEKEKLES